jgi:hypothetical protein
VEEKLLHFDFERLEKDCRERRGGRAQQNRRSAIKELKNDAGLLCELAKISRSRYYKYLSAVKDIATGKGNCIDNAPIESFFGHMKDELDYKSCLSFEELRLAIEKYMRYYNYERKQRTRKRMAPVEYRNHLLTRVDTMVMGFQNVH